MWLVQFSYADNMARQPKQLLLSSWDIQSVPGGKVNILGGHSIGHSKQNVYMNMCPTPNGYRGRGI